MRTSDLRTYFDNDNVFEHSENEPQVGDIALWKGHVGIVTGVGKGGKVKITHARGEGKLAKENPYVILPEEYRNSEFYR